jgi:hypothetical protein
MGAEHEGGKVERIQTEQTKWGRGAERPDLCTALEHPRPLMSSAT